jgi:hypothetical protein
VALAEQIRNRGRKQSRSLRVVSSNSSAMASQQAVTDAINSADSNQEDYVNQKIAAFGTSIALVYEPKIAAGTTGQFLRGDKTWQAIAINDVTGLSSSLSGLSSAAAAKLSIPAIQTITTDAAATVSPSVTNTTVLHTGTLTANRTVTLSTAGVTTGSVIRVVRTGTGAFSLTIGGLKALATNTWCDVVFNGTVWQLTAYGTL